MVVTVRRPMPGHSITSICEGDAFRIIFREPSFGGMFVGEDLEAIASPTALLVST
jgi:hypothetical protein